MPRYFFDLHESGAPSLPDEEGSHLSSFDDAKVAALRDLAHVAAYELMPAGDRSRSWTVIVTDTDRQPVYTARLMLTGVEIGSGTPRN